MDNKNVFVAIALSMSVLLFWGAFFETPRKPQLNKFPLKKKKKKMSKVLLLRTISQQQIIKK